MKMLYEFDTMVTPESWMESVLKYQEKEHEEKITIRPSKKRKSFKVMLIAAALIIISSVSVFAYNIISGKNIFNSFFKEPPKNEVPMDTGQLETEGSEKDDNDRLTTTGSEKDNTRTTEELSATDRGLKITCTDAAVTDTTVSFRMEVETEDGSSLYENTEERWSVEGSQQFKEVSLFVDGWEYEKVEKITTRDYGVAENKRIFEYCFEVEDSLVNREIRLCLYGYLETYTEIIDIGATYETLGDLLRDVDLDNQPQTGELIYPTLGSPFALYNPTEGDGNHFIKYSEKYPDSYIDVAGIYDCIIEGKKMKALYIGIKNSEPDINDFRQMESMNVIDIKTKSSDDVFEGLRYKTNYYGGNLMLILPHDEFGRPKDFTKELLDQYTLCEVNRSDSQINNRHVGYWNFNIILDESGYITRRHAENINIQDSENIHIDEIFFDGIELVIKGTGASELEADALDIEFIMEDGSSQKVVKAEIYTHRWLSIENFSISGSLADVGDASKVRAIKWCGQKIQLEEKMN